MMNEHDMLLFCSLIQPLKYCGDYRPYFTIHDSEYKSYTTKTQPPLVIWSRLIAHLSHEFYKIHTWLTSIFGSYSIYGNTKIVTFSKSSVCLKAWLLIICIRDSVYTTLKCYCFYTINNKKLAELKLGKLCYFRQTSLQ